MMLHEVAGRVFVVLFRKPNVSMLPVSGGLASASVLPGRPGCGCVFLSPTLGVFVSNERLGLQKKRLVLHGLCFVLFHCTFKIELSALCSSFNNHLTINC